MAGEHDITVLLHAWSSGDSEAGERLGKLVYQELREMARKRLAGERGDHTLQPTALVNEAYLRMVQGGRAAQRPPALLCHGRPVHALHPR